MFKSLQPHSQGRGFRGKLRMVCFIGASCLDNTKNSLSYRERQNLSQRLYCIRGLSFKSANLELRKEEFKDLNYLLTRGKLKTANDIVLWHDIVSNSINSHKCNRNTHCHIDEFQVILNGFGSRISDVAYARRCGALNYFKQLKNKKYWVNNEKIFLSDRKQKCADTVSELRKVHPCVKLEFHLFDILNRHQKISNNSYSKRRNKTNNTGSRQRKAKKSFMLLQKMSCLKISTDSVKKRSTTTQLIMKFRAE